MKGKSTTNDEKCELPRSLKSLHSIPKSKLWLEFSLAHGALDRQVNAMEKETPTDRGQ